MPRFTFTVDTVTREYYEVDADDILDADQTVRTMLELGARPEYSDVLDSENPLLFNVEAS